MAQGCPGLLREAKTFGQQTLPIFPSKTPFLQHSHGNGGTNLMYSLPSDPIEAGKSILFELRLFGVSAEPLRDVFCQRARLAGPGFAESSCGFGGLCWVRGN